MELLLTVMGPQTLWQHRLPTDTIDPCVQQLTELPIEVGGRGSNWFWRLIDESIRWVEHPDVRFFEAPSGTAQRFVFVVEQTGHQWALEWSDAVVPGTRYTVTEQQVLHIGAHAEAVIQMSDTASFSLEWDQTSWHLTVSDVTQSWCYVARQRACQHQRLSVGTVVHAPQLTCVLGVGFLRLHTAGSSVRCQLSMWHASLAADRLLPPFAVQQLSRLPQFAAVPQPYHCTIEAPSKRQKPEPQPIWQLVGPLATAGLSTMGFALLSLSYAIQSQQWGGLVAPILLSGSVLTGALFMPMMQRRYQRQRSQYLERQRQAHYRHYLAVQQQQLEQAQAQFVQQLAYYYPLQVNRWWQAHVCAHRLTIRLGTATRHQLSQVTLKQGSFSFETDVLSAAQQAFVLQIPDAEAAPYTLSLADYPVTTILAADEADVAAIYRHVTSQLVTQYGYDELALAVLDDTEDGHRLKWCPHASHVFADVQIATDTTQAQQLLQQVAWHVQHAPHPIHWVVLVRNSNLVPHRAQMDELCRLAQEHERLQVLFFTANAQDVVAHSTALITVLDATQAAIVQLQPPTADTVSALQIARQTTAEQQRLMAKMARTHLTGHRSAVQRQTVLTFLDMYEVATVEQLAIAQRWRRNRNRTGLPAVVGRDEHGQLVVLDIHDQADGPHGLVAGMTGSGKSEWLISYILALAIDYAPEQVSFVIIDFKGGGIATVCQPLPHICGLMTNLDEQEAARVLSALRAELEVRQRLFQAIRQQFQLGVVSIDVYQALYDEGRIQTPLPHLVIVVDEFAELKQAQPDFMDQLIQIARIGRSLGLHLILATQKPHGVVNEQIWSNSRFRVCLKVQDAMDSRDVLDNTDASQLSQAGQFYLKVGNGERYVCGCSGWSGAVYHEAQRIAPQRLLLRTLQQRTWYDLSHDVTGVCATDQQEVGALIASMQQLASRRAAPLWAPPLAASQPLHTLQAERPTVSVGTRFSAIIGRYDDLANRTQPVLTLDWPQVEHVALYGSVGSGKTQLIDSLLHDLQDTAGLTSVSVLLIDLIDGLRQWQHQPLISHYVNRSMPDKLAYIFETAQAILDQRQRSTEPFPPVLVIVHYANHLLENYGPYHDILRRLLKEGPHAQLFVLLSVPCHADLSYRFTDYIKTSLCLQLLDAQEYLMILGSRINVPIQERIGWGICRKDAQLYAFQAAETQKKEDQDEARIDSY